MAATVIDGLVPSTLWKKVLRDKSNPTPLKK